MGRKMKMRRRDVLTLMSGVMMAPPLSPALTQGVTNWRVPAEEALHERTFLQWPVSRAVYPERWFLREVQSAILALANTIAAYEPIVILAEASHHSAIRRHVSDGVDLWNIPTDDLWARDSGPLFCVDGHGGLAIRQLNFNGWGGRQSHSNDGLIAERVALRLGVPILDNGLVGEPGGVEQDGAGTLMAHESSWVNPNRNSGTRHEIERLLLEAYGASQMIWAPGLMGLDITDYHIDALARFVRPGSVLMQMPGYADSSDPWNRAAHDTRAILETTIDGWGRTLQISEIHDPRNARVNAADFLASYANYYVCNGAVIAAEFGDAEADAMAHDTLTKLYPEREVVAVNVDALGWIGGGIHCATQQQPAV